MIHIKFEEIFNENFMFDYKNFILYGNEWNGEGYKFNLQESEKEFYKKIKFSKSGEKHLYEIIEYVKDKHPNSKVKNFFTFLYKNIETILVGNFNEIKELAIKFSSLSTNKYKNENKEIKKICKEVFNYEKLYNKENFPYFMEKILNMFYKKIKVCPYCNRQYIDVFNNTSRTFDFEHHFHKSRYFIFSISLANLLPSCKSCNQRKGTIDVLSEDFLSPYEEVRVCFSIEYDEKEIGNTNSLTTIESSIKKITVEQDRGSNVEKLYLEELYQLHKDIVAEIELKKRAFPNIRKSFFDKKTFGDLDFEDFYRIIFANYIPENDKDSLQFLKRPLSKLTFDIYKELTSTPV